jgi:hypothetical protein
MSTVLLSYALLTSALFGEKIATLPPGPAAPLRLRLAEKDLLPSPARSDTPPVRNSSARRGAREPDAREGTDTWRNHAAPSQRAAAGGPPEPSTLHP